MKDLLKHITLGAAGGLVGTVAMRLYWQVATALAGEDPRGWTQDNAPHGLDEVGIAGQHHAEGESSTAAVGREAYETLVGKEPSSETKTALSYAVHWSYGTTMGGLYGALRGRQEAPDAKGGLAFGAALWLLGDELMVPVLGLSKGPTAYPPAQHLHRLGAHLAYGLAAAATAQAGHALLRDGRSRRPSVPRLGLQRAGKMGKTCLTWKAGRQAAGWVGAALRR